MEQKLARHNTEAGYADERTRLQIREGSTPPESRLALDAPSRPVHAFRSGDDPMSLPAGWYVNKSGIRKYWTGAEWVTPEAEAEQPAASAADPPATSPQVLGGDDESSANRPNVGRAHRRWGRRRVIALLGAVLILSAGGALVAKQLKNTSPSLAAGWRYMIDASVAYDSDRYDFDPNRGVLITQASGSLRAPTEDDTSLSELRRQATDDWCDLVLTDDGDIERWKVSDLLINTLFEAASHHEDPAERYEEEYAAIAQRVERALPPEPEILDPDYDAWHDQYNTVFRETLEELHPELVDDVEAWETTWAEIRSSVFNESMVQDSQRFVVSKCGLTVPEGYEYQTATELGIDTD